MATQGTPLAGRNELARRSYVIGADCALVAYMNPALSLDDNTVMADLMQPPLANGYAPIILSKANYSVDAAVVTYIDPTTGNPEWAATGPWGSNPVNGIAMVFGSVVLHFMDLSQPFIAAAGKRLAGAIADLIGG